MMLFIADLNFMEICSTVLASTITVLISIDLPIIRPIVEGSDELACIFKVGEQVRKGLGKNGYGIYSVTA